MACGVFGLFMIIQTGKGQTRERGKVKKEKIHAQAHKRRYGVEFSR
jgi:hypothetical protein